MLNHARLMPARFGICLAFYYIIFFVRELFC